MGLLLSSSGVETNSVAGCAILSPACSGSRSKECWAIRTHGRRRRKAIPTIPLDVVLSDPASEFSDLYRLVDVCGVRDIRVTMPAAPGLFEGGQTGCGVATPGPGFTRSTDGRGRLQSLMKPWNSTFMDRWSRRRWSFSTLCLLRCLALKQIRCG